MAQSAVSKHGGRSAAIALSSILAMVLAVAMFAAPGIAYAAQDISAGSVVQVGTTAAKSAKLEVVNASIGKVVLKKGASYKLGATASAGKITYKSSKPKVVSVSSKGALKAKKAGKATITVKAQGVTKKIKVTVVKAAKYKAVKSITAKVAKSQLKAGESTKASVTFKPAGASNKNLVYKSSNPGVATVDAKGNIKAVAKGTATITVKSPAKAKAKATFKITVAAAESDVAPKPTPDPVDPEPVTPVDPFNTGAIDVTKAGRGEETVGLATLEEAINFNRIEQDESQRSNDPTYTMTTVPYLHATDYGKDVDLQIEILTPSTAKAATTPLVVWINGGGFTNSDAAGNLEMRMAIARAGYVVASVQHRTSVANATFPTPLQDIKAAIRYLKANAATYKFNKNMVAVAGNSSGGYYATMVGVTSNVKSILWPNRSGALVETNLDVGANLEESSAVNAVVDFYGVSDLTIIGANLANPALSESHKSAATTEALLLNGAAAAQKGVGVFNEAMKDKIAAASPFTYIDENDPAFIIFHGDADTLVSPVASKMLQNRLEEAGISAERFVISGAGHGGNQFYTDYVNDKVKAFLDANAGTAIPAEITYVAGDHSKAELLEYDEDGNGSYKAEAQVPTLEEATANADTVAVDPEKWVLNQAKDITYKTVRTSGTYQNLKMHIIMPSRAGDRSPRPVLYCAQCGGFNKSNPSALLYQRYAERGYVVAVSEVRVVPNATLPTPLQDAKAGVRWLRAHATTFNINPDCIIAIGQSAGGYMGVMLGVLSNTTQFDDKVKFDVGDNLEYSSAVQAVVDHYGVSDLTIIGAGLPNYNVHDSESNTEALLVNGTAFGANPGGSIFSDLDAAAKYSPFTYVDKDDPPFLIFHGDDHDTSVSPVSTMELYKRLTDAGATAERYTLVGMGHGGWQIQTPAILKMTDDFMDNIAAQYAK